jgi:hypothetical protein
MTPLDIGKGYVPDFIRDEILPNLPRQSGEGIHRALYDLARVLTPWRTAAQREAILRSYAARCDRPVPETELQAALRDGARHAWKPNGYTVESSPQSPQPKFNLEAFKRFVAGAPLVDGRWLAERSSIPVDEQTPATFLYALFREGEKVIIFDSPCSPGKAIWTHPGGRLCGARLHASLDRFVKGAPSGIWFLSNPIDGVWRPNGAEKWSLRSEGNITSWRHLVLESDRDDISEGEWLTFLAGLHLPIAAIVETGRRLPHALLRIDAETKAEWDHIRNRLAPLLIRGGADPNSLSAVRLTRLPGCERLGWEDEHGVYREFADGPRVQRLLYLTPQPTCTPITAMQEATCAWSAKSLKRI